jgi:hypothetical protein
MIQQASEVFGQLSFISFLAISRRNTHPSTLSRAYVLRNRSGHVVKFEQSQIIASTKPPDAFGWTGREGYPITAYARSLQ